MPSPWIERFAPLVRPGGLVLDLACGNGRNGRIFLARGHPVVLVDRDVRAVQDLAAGPGVEIRQVDLETPGRAAAWPFFGRTFAAVVGVNYLHRPLFGDLMDSLAEAGVLLYDTFARGNERFGRPRNPDHLLNAGELLTLVGSALHVVAYEHGLIDDPACPGVKQRICAVKAPLDADGQPIPCPVTPAQA